MGNPTLARLIGMMGKTVAPAPAAATDPYFSNVVLLLHMDGTNGGTTFTDSSSYGKSFSTYTGSPVTSSTQAKFGTTSGSFYPSGVTAGISTASSTDFNFGTGDFTIECWNYWDGDTSELQVICLPCSGAAFDWVFGYSATNGYLRLSEKSGAGKSTTTKPTANQWNHIAVCRASGLLMFYVNGVNVYSVADTTDFNTAYTMYVGGNALSYRAAGYIDDLRITKGIARYTNNFTVPSAAFPNAGNTPYATWNPSDKGAGITLSGGNLIATCVASNTSCRATLGKSSGKWYWEVVSTSNQAGIGVSKSTDVTSTWVGGGTNSYGWYGADGKLYNNGSGLTPANGTYTTNTLGFALDMDNGTLYCYLDNVLQPKIITGLSGTYYPGVGNNTAFSATANFGQNPLTYTPPNGTFWNPKDCDTVDAPAFTNNNMTVSGPTGSTYYGFVRANTGKSTGKWYFEVKRTVAGGWTIVGVADAASSTALVNGNSATSWSMQSGNGNKTHGAGNWPGSAYGTSFITGDVVGIAVNMTDGKLYFSINGTWQNSGTPGGAETGYAFNSLTGTLYPSVSSATSPDSLMQATLNTGATPFAYTPPSGYSAWDATVYSAGIY